MKQLIRHILREHVREISEYTRWTPEMVTKVAKKYKRRSDFQKENPAAYKWARENGIIDNVTSHMEKSKTGKSNTNDFIDKIKEVHGDKYGYDKVDYKGANTDVIVTCSKHGDFKLPPNKLLSGRGCQKCALENRGFEQRMTNQEFIDQSNMVHDGKYGYSKVDYKTARQRVIITCPIHGDFPQTPSHHLGGQGCPICGYQILGNRKDLNDFLEDSEIIHGDKYDYSKVDYKDANSKVIITCPIHGDFEQTPSKHINSAQGCPSCKESKGEKLINNLLIKNKIKLIRQKRFIDCTNTLKGTLCRQLPFDFYLPEFNTCVEYDGEQHYKPVLTFGGEEAFKRLQGRDKIKNKYCKKNGIKLIRIPYTMKKDEIEPYILKELGIK